MQEKDRLKYRESFQEILKSKATLERITYMEELLSSMSTIICIINKSNQIVFRNDVLLDKFGVEFETDILGKRPGEIFNCENAKNDCGGCGMSDKCQYCGAYNAIEHAWQDNKKMTSECRITSVKNETTHQYDFEITASPMLFEDQYMIISIIDISEKKRKELLERIFFHDILNIAGSLSGIIKLYPDVNEENKAEFLKIMNSLNDQIIDEIKAQQLINKAESGDLHVNLTTIKVDDFINKLMEKMKFHQVAYDKEIIINNLVKEETITTDPLLLTRVLFNMMKNALEAILFQESITVQVEKTDDQFRFSVHNQTSIPQETKDQIFKRSFSTKGFNRGLGTYSMKLLVEKYLNGKIGFTSNDV